MENHIITISITKKKNITYGITTPTMDMEDLWQQRRSEDEMIAMERKMKRGRVKGRGPKPNQKHHLKEREKAEEKAEEKIEAIGNVSHVEKNATSRHNAPTDGMSRRQSSEIGGTPSHSIKERGRVKEMHPSRARAKARAIIKEKAKAWELEAWDPWKSTTINRGTISSSSRQRKIGTHRNGISLDR